MISSIQELVDHLDRSNVTPAMRRIGVLARSETARINFHTDHMVNAGEIASIWKCRLRMVTRKKRRKPGLASLVRELGKLPPETALQQISLRDGLTSGLLWVEPASHRTIGAVISVRTPADVKRSWDNYRMANGQTVEPARKRAVGSRREVKSSPAIAALHQ